ncbi:Fic family protein [Limnospira indica]|uniref:Fic family protein n=1 Tax=Limnospira indica TaxID=147322 RepID=UPI001862255E|nr:hypothetical protein [Limnospira indica]QNH60359.1 MAG: hypothetical protein H2674_23705 [Limnospira indica BM01]
MQDCNAHTVLCLPRKTFTPDFQGVKANVVFFQKDLPTEAVWIFDDPSNVLGMKKVPTNPKPSSEHYEPSSEHYEPSSEHYEPSSEHYEPSSEHYEPSSEHYQRLEEIAAPVRAKSRISKEIVEQVILKLCSEHYLPLRTLADLLKREPDSIRNHYVNPMLKQGLLEARYPNEPTHPQQAYRTLSPPEITKVSDPG